MKAEEGKISGFLPVWLAIGTGVLLFLSFPGAVGLWPAAWIGLVPLLVGIRNVTPGRAASLGLAAGMVHYVSLLYWITIVLGRYGNLPLWISVPALLLLALYMSSYLALFCFLMNRAWGRNRVLAVWFGPLLWVGLDYVRSLLFSGFPWQDLAYSQYKALFLVQTADLTGHFGITFNIVLVNCVTGLLFSLWRDSLVVEGDAGTIMLSLKIRQAWYHAVLPTICIMVLVLAYNILRFQQITGIIEQSPKMKIGAVQGNIEQDQKWSPAMRLKTIETYGDLTSRAMARGAEPPPTLTVWPETALPFLVSDNPYFNVFRKQFFKEKNTWLLTGAPYYERVAGSGQPEAAAEPVSYNSAYLFTPEGSVSGRYDKQHLVPFGEYVPLGRFLPLPGPLVENIGDFSAGRPIAPLSCETAEIGVLICFESIFPKLARNWAAGGANLLVNITNDAWFGRSSAPWQHLSMSVFRAVENRRSLVRTANTGVSVFIDPLGRMSGATPLFQAAYLVEEVPLLKENTVFTGFGNHFGLFCLLAGLVLAIVIKSNKPLLIR